MFCALLSFCCISPKQFSCLIHLISVCTLFPYLCVDFTMLNFVKPHLLGTRGEFTNRFINPITNGQCADSTPRDVKMMKSRSHVLNRLLEATVHRRDVSSLLQYLPKKYEYTFSIRLSPLQVKLYRAYLKSFVDGKNTRESVSGGRWANSTTSHNQSINLKFKSISPPRYRATVP